MKCPKCSQYNTMTMLGGSVEECLSCGTKFTEWQQELIETYREALEGIMKRRETPESFMIARSALYGGVTKL